MSYITLEEIIADIGKPNVTPKQLIQAAYNLGADIEEEEEVIEEEVEVEAEEEEAEEEEIE